MANPEPETSLRRSLRLQESTSCSSSTALPSKDNKKTSKESVVVKRQDVSFPLASLLGLSVPFRDYVLPHLSLRDLSALEMVDKACFHAMRSNPYWQRAWHCAIASNRMYQKISQNIVGVDRFSDADVST